MCLHFAESLRGLLGERRLDPSYLAITGLRSIIALNSPLLERRVRVFETNFFECVILCYLCLVKGKQPKFVNFSYNITINEVHNLIDIFIMYEQEKMLHTKKSRTSRASPLQVTKMIDYFYINKGLAEGRFHALHGKEEAQKKWAELAMELNCFQGATKTAEQWQVVWRDLKSRTSKKAKELRKAKALTGNKTIIQSELTELELRIIGIIGAEYVEGSKHCAESIPEEENLLEELEHGNNSVLSAIPEVISVCTNIPQKVFPDSQNSNANSLDVNDIDVCIDNWSVDINSQHDHAINDIGDSDVIQNIITCEPRNASNAPKTTTIPSSWTSRKTPYPLPTTKQTEQLNKSSHIHKSTSSKTVDRVKRTLPDKLESSRDYFQSIANDHVKAEIMHAESAKIQAKASEMNALALTEIAHAITKLADTAVVQAVNDTERIRVFEKLTTVLDNLLPNYVN